MHNYTTITLSGKFRETGPLAKSPMLATAGPQFRLDRFLATVQSIGSSRKIDRVLISAKSDFHVTLFAGLEAIRKAMLELRAHGKKTMFFAQSYGTKELYLATAADERYVHPLGSVRFPGLSFSSLYLGKAVRELDIEGYVARRGSFKTAPERFMRTDMSAADREQYGRYIDVVMKTLTEDIVSTGIMTREDIDELLSGRIISPNEAIERGWLTGSLTAEGYRQNLKEKKQKSREVKSRPRSTRGRRVAVLVFEGAVGDGRSRYSPLTGQSIGPDSYVPVIRKLKDSRLIEGVVFRVNSGGGSATGSDDILEELGRLAEKKPLVTSFAEVAASGGYWMACRSERIFAERTTLTGSIGAFMLSIHAEKLFKRFGIFSSGIRTGASADAGSVFRALTAFERQQIELEIERVYQAFLEKVATARGKDIAQIDAIGRGRVWSGQDAVEIGLVDELGGIPEAAEYLRRKTNKLKAGIEFHPRMKYSMVERIVYGNIGRGSTSVVGIADPIEIARSISREVEAMNGKAMLLMPDSLLPDLPGHGTTPL